jgi:tryptophan halogenase
MNFQAPPLEALLIRACQSSGVEMLSGDLAAIERGVDGITGLRLDDGSGIGADLYLDCDGGLQSDATDFLDYPGLCTRALTMLRRRGSEPVRPCATVTQNDSGYQWRVEHDDAVGLGLAWHAAHSNEATAHASLLGKSAAVLAGPVLHEWRPGRLRDAWQDNVIALGDASGFLEPLAALRSGVLIMQIDWVRRLLAESEGQPGPATRRLYNRVTGRIWDEMRDFTALHHRFNGSNSPAWREAQAIDPGGHGELIAMFQSLGPSIQLSNCLPFWPGAIGIDGWIATLLGLGVPFTPRDLPAEALAAWQTYVAANRQIAKQAVDLETCLAAVRKSHAPRAVEDTSY